MSNVRPAPRDVFVSSTRRPIKNKSRPARNWQPSIPKLWRCLWPITPWSVISVRVYRADRNKEFYWHAPCIKSPKLLVLDEATSHLDVWNEQAVNAAIKQIPLTRVIVAHRPETIGMAQRVVVLQQGAIVQDVMQPSTQPTT
jgi:hypothetical protein